MPSQVKKYRRQVEVVEGFQYDETNASDVIAFTGEAAYINSENGKLYLKHPGGAEQEIRNTDWTLHDQWKNNFVMSDTDFKIVYAPGPN